MIKKITKLEMVILRSDRTIKLKIPFVYEEDFEGYNLF